MSAPVTAEEIENIRLTHESANPVQRDYGWQFAFDSIETLLRAIAEQNKSHAVQIEELEDLIGACYQMAGCVGAPVRFLDALSGRPNGEQLLPVSVCEFSEIQRMHEPVTAQNYGPTLAAEINALPSRLRSYVHDLEIRADPAGDVRRAFAAEEKAQAAEVLIRELQQQWLARSPAYDPTLVEDADRMQRALSADQLHGAAQLIPRLLSALRDAQLQSRVDAQRRYEADALSADLSSRLAEFTAALTDVRAEQPDIEKIRTENWLDDHASCHDVDTLLACITDLQRAEAAWRNARTIWEIEVAQLRRRDVILTERNERLIYALRDANANHERRVGELMALVNDGQAVMEEFANEFDPVTEWQGRARAALAQPPQAEQE